MTVTDQQVLDAVKVYVHQRHMHLTKSNVIGWDEEDLDRVITTNGYLDFTIDLEIESREETEDGTTWYVEATLFFQTETEPLECDPEVYECYRCGDEWCIQWSHC